MQEQERKSSLQSKWLKQCSRWYRQYSLIAEECSGWRSNELKQAMVSEPGLILNTVLRQLEPLTQGERSIEIKIGNSNLFADLDRSGVFVRSHKEDVWAQFLSYRYSEARKRLSKVLFSQATGRDHRTFTRYPHMSIFLPEDFAMEGVDVGNLGWVTAYGPAVIISGLGRINLAGRESGHPTHEASHCLLQLYFPEIYHRLIGPNSYLDEGFAIAASLLDTKGFFWGMDSQRVARLVGQERLLDFNQLSGMGNYQAELYPQRFVFGFFVWNLLRRLSHWGREHAFANSPDELVKNVFYEGLESFSTISNLWPLKTFFNALEALNNEDRNLPLDDLENAFWRKFLFWPNRTLEFEGKTDWREATERAYLDLDLLSRVNTYYLDRLDLYTDGCLDRLDHYTGGLFKPSLDLK